MTHYVGIFGHEGQQSSREDRLLRHRTFVARLFMCLLAASLVAACSLPGYAQTSYVPPVVVSSVSQVAVPDLVAPTGSETNLIQPAEVALDACGNIYTLDFGKDSSTGTTITEIPIGGGPASVVENLGSYYFGHLGQDPTHAYLIAGQSYGTGGNSIPIVHCVPQPSEGHHIGGGNGPLFYYYNPGYFAGDFLGNTYISTQYTCCVTGDYFLIQEPAGNGSNGDILLSNQQAEIQSLAVDKNQNVYFISANVLYELHYFGDGNYATTPVSFGTAYTNPVGVSADVAGNLYIADYGAATFYEIPSETTYGGGTALNPADQFIVATGVTSTNPVAINAHGDIFYTDSILYVNANFAETVSFVDAVEKLTVGGADFGSVAIGQTATRTLNFQFNSPATLEEIRSPTGAFATTSGGSNPSPCTKGVAYAGFSGSTSSCAVVVEFKPERIGPQSSTLVLEDAKGDTIATASLEGIGEAAQVPVGTTTTLTVSPGSNLIAGEQIALTALITPDSGPLVPTTGTVTFADPSGGDITVPVIGGTASYYGFVPRAGTYSVFASYNGSSGFAVSKSTTITGTVTAPPRQ